MSYFVHKTYPWVPVSAVSEIQKDLIDTFRPSITFDSQDYKNWIAKLDLFTCILCRKTHGKVYGINEVILMPPPIHTNCRCEIKRMVAALAGSATQRGMDGADYAVKHTGTLPSYYITKAEATELGWIRQLGNLNDIAPGKSIGGDVYANRNGHLPDLAGRIWYEADINYDSGIRNGHRLLFSNDGLIFATYDHYKTFIHIQ